MTTRHAQTKAAQRRSDETQRPVQFVSDDFLADRYQKSRGTIWRWARERVAGFPQPVKIGPTTRWNLADIEAWEAAQLEVAA